MSVGRAAGLTHVAALLVVASVMVMLYGQIDYAAEQYSGWDLVAYREMASAAPKIAASIGQPFAFRILGPYLVGLLPVPDPLGFYALAIVSSIVLVTLLYHFLCSTGLPSFVSAVAVMLFTFNRHWYGFTVWDYFQINDVLSLIVLVALLRSMLEARWVVFGLMLFVGAMARETCILIVPVALVYLLERKELSTAWRRALVAVVPGLAALALTRIFVPAAGGDSLAETFLWNLRRGWSLERLFRLLVDPLLPFSFIPVVFFDTTRRFFRARKHALVLVVLVLLSTFFGCNDDRLTAPAFVVAYALIGSVIQQTKCNRVFLAILVVCGFLSSLHHSMARFPLPNATLTRALSLGSLSVVTIGALAFRLWCRVPRGGGSVHARPGSVA